MEEFFCTGCEPPRPITRESDQHEWQHVDDATYAEVFHVHVSRSARDCDGAYYQDRVLRPNSYREVPLAHHVWRNATNAYFPYHAPCTVKIEEVDGEPDGLLRMNWSRRTDEGYEAGELKGCIDPSCAYQDSEFRDYTAEAAGY